ncbi:HK97-gp10 family putative phage morphogenesis protein [Rhodovulum sp. DZ06]|uniref:HK97-gp10 family putative phage morphogenesis protein n=1 Tax=Rhodovulum sp. DZ06 TaxID=3425126 RepID=UPI003D32839D
MSRRSEAMTFSMEGGRELDAVLAELPAGVAKGVARRGLKRAAVPVRDEIKARAPELSGALKESIGVVVGRTRTLRDAGGMAAHEVYKEYGASAQALSALLATRRSEKAAGRGARPLVRLEASVVVSAPHAHFQEFGTSKMDPHPFMRPAWDASWGAAQDILLRETWDEVRKTAARRARKARRNGKDGAVWDALEARAGAKAGP